MLWKRYVFHFFDLVAYSKRGPVWKTLSVDYRRRVAVNLALRVCCSCDSQRSNYEPRNRKVYVLLGSKLKHLLISLAVMIVSACMFILGYAMTWGP